MSAPLQCEACFKPLALADGVRHVLVIDPIGTQMPAARARSRKRR